MNRLVIYLLVRTDLKMSTGKICAQTGHAVQDLVLKCPPKVLREYRRDGQTKITLQIRDEEEMLYIWEQCQEKKLPTEIVEDHGLTQVPEGSRTVLGIGPFRRYEAYPIVGKLKLL